MPMLVLVIIGILIVTIVVLKQKQQLERKLLFLLYITSLTYVAFIIYLINSGWIIEYPHFFKTGGPVCYLVPVAFYLYGKHVFKDSLKWTDYLWLLLPVLNVVELIPFYLQPVEHKIALLSKIALDKNELYLAKEGLIPTYWHNVFYLLFGTISSFAVFILSKRKRKSGTAINIEGKLLHWISLLLLCFYISGLLAHAFSSNTFVHGFVSIAVGITFLIIFIYFFLEPRILYGPEVEKKNGYQVKSSNVSISNQEVTSYRKQVDAFFVNESSYLNSDFKLEDLAKHLTVTKNTASYIINTSFRLNFNQLLNKKRVDVVIEHFENDKWVNLSLDGVAEKVGFRSRTTFIKAFKDNVGLPPSEYRKLKCNPNSKS